MHGVRSIWFEEQKQAERPQDGLSQAGQRRRETRLHDVVGDEGAEDKRGRHQREEGHPPSTVVPANNQSTRGAGGPNSRVR